MSFTTSPVAVKEPALAPGAAISVTVLAGGALVPPPVEPPEPVPVDALPPDEPPPPQAARPPAAKAAMIVLFMLFSLFVAQTADAAACQP
ncbi:hypothetical protein [Burkholderia thailandensis]|uniref:hypothetical protein n=1 Tax=Burkholderia thailandensis TaxID=57975 RepID=UPI000B2DA81B|nr:hypothetical protein [Burkholderia thailandensis]MCS6495810.1 hypothetical protein [Burkholderia thailandensis]